ncbi:hypothetical protein B4O97_01615 [Marispirochaeta aestuarii]|uniref:Tripartite ATP-independent periplasmic transporters DctQ component domain-containing protein n=1 Tax=Marispirochaeta aestuarii TaxID=1963862 RepID=A0A1Y1S1S0_9SPIO|nr:TRAP transporter small permease [Marispirochaeta aestuarii]ORC37726.1 hypothetical protein B4O97_01615 [Marispirochaeta aestuarii]
MVKYLKQASDIVHVVTKWWLFVYVLSVTILAIVGVFFRAIGNSLSWNEELMRWILIGIGYIGAAVALKERSHIGIEFFITRMKPKLRKFSIILGYLTIVLFLLVVLIYGYKSADVAWRQKGSILRVPMYWVKLNLPLGSLFMLVHMTYFTVGFFKEKGDDREYLLSGGHDF